jgi:hypothetical protein
MKERQWTEGKIAAHIGRQTLARRCVLLVDRCTWTGHECDLLAVTLDLRIIDVEIKISRGDLRADAKKDKWWWRASWQDPIASREFPPKVWKHYYAMPAAIWTDDLYAALPSERSGVLLLDEHAGQVIVQCKRRATPNKAAQRLTAGQAVDIARLANLRMWDAYAQRDCRAPAKDHQQAVAAHHEEAGCKSQ